MALYLNRWYQEDTLKEREQNGHEPADGLVFCHVQANQHHIIGRKRADCKKEKPTQEGEKFGHLTASFLICGNRKTCGQAGKKYKYEQRLNEVTLRLLRLQVMIMIKGTCLEGELQTH